jgi:lysozyme family protein
MIRAHFGSTGLIDQKVKMRLYDHEAMGENNFLDETPEFTIKESPCYVRFALNEKVKKRGANLFSDNVFVEIEIMETKAHVFSTQIKVNTNNSIIDIARNITKSKYEKTDVEKGVNCEGKFCIKKGDPRSELIREVNIRLAGFGGNVPTDEFTERTEKMIKQFQRDYMKVPETGKICGNVLKAIDDFSSKFDISATLWGQLKCSCDTKGKNVTSKLRTIKELNNCAGWGDHSGKDTYKATPNNEANHNYEYPGIHRSLLFGIKALQFYFSQQTTYTMDHITSGYRCRFKNYKTTNHQGKAIDIQFSKGDWEIRYAVKKNLKALEDIRDIFYIKYLGAQKNWPNKNVFSTEPIDLLYYPDGSLRYDHTFSWLHIDVREFESIYLEDKYFCKSSTNLNSESIVKLAKDAGFAKTCMCMPSIAAVNNSPNTKTSITCEDKFKKVAQIILNHEGGYVNHPNDKGGPTNKGITQSTWNKFAMSDVNKEPTLDNLKTITDEDATKIYWKRYWEPKGFCKISDEKVSLMIYDWTITSGGAIKEVQKLLVNEFEKNVTIDGGIGNQTITAINDIQDQDKLLKKLSEIRKQYYTDLTITKGKKNTQEVFLKGWLNRVDDCLNFKP